MNDCSLLLEKNIWQFLTNYKKNIHVHIFITVAINEESHFQNVAYKNKSSSA